MSSSVHKNDCLFRYNPLSGDFEGVTNENKKKSKQVESIVEEEAELKPVGNPVSGRQNGRRWQSPYAIMNDFPGRTFN